MATRATRTELAVLGLLAWKGEASGYELHKLAGRTVGFIWAPARSQLYAVLKRLERDGLVSGRRVAQSDRPDKRIVALTGAGRDVLRAWLDSLEPIAPEDRDGVLLRVFFGALGSPGALQAQLRDYRERVNARLATYRELEATFDPDPDPAGLHRLQSLRMGIALMQASREWTDGTLAVLAAANRGDEAGAR
jgi:DNA-binding PadR family transcriptional regulator